MKVSIVGFNFSAIGGLEIVSKAIANAVVAQGHSVDVFALHETGNVDYEGFTTTGLASRGALPQRLVQWFRFARQSSRIVERISTSDIVIAAHAHTLRYFLPQLLQQRTRPKVVCWLHGREVWGGLGRQAAPLLKQSDELIAVSNFTANTVHKLLDGQRLPQVIHNPVETDIFIPLVDRSEIRRHHILIVGRHDIDSWHKGYDTLIEAMGILARNRPDLPLHLTIAGSGDLLNQHRRHIARLALQDKVSLAGRVSRAELVRLYQTCDLFAFPSRYESRGGENFGEGFGVVNAEAAACGRPVITSSHGGCPETVNDSVTGFVIDPTSPEKLASKIALLFDLSADDRDAMGQRGREMAVQQFSPQCFRRQVAELISRESLV